MYSNLVNQFGGHPAKGQYAQETILAECRVNNELCVLLHHILEITHFLVHVHEKNRLILTKENVQASHNNGLEVTIAVAPFSSKKYGPYTPNAKMYTKP